MLEKWGVDSKSLDNFETNDRLRALGLLAKEENNDFNISLAARVNEIRADADDPDLRKKALWANMDTQFNSVDVTVS